MVPRDDRTMAASPETIIMRGKCEEIVVHQYNSLSVDTRHSFGIAGDMRIECSEGNLGETREETLHVWTCSSHSPQSTRYAKY